MNLILTIVEFCLFFISIAAIQIVAVYLLRFMQPEMATADLVAILSGSKDLITSGCRILTNPDATHL